MTKIEIHDMIVGEVMSLWPATVAVFNRRRMACPGCAMSPFMTVDEAALSHNQDAASLADELLAAIAPDGTPAAGVMGTPRG